MKHRDVLHLKAIIWAEWYEPLIPAHWGHPEEEPWGSGPRQSSPIGASGSVRGAVSGNQGRVTDKSTPHWHLDSKQTLRSIYTYKHTSKIYICICIHTVWVCVHVYAHAFFNSSSSRIKKQNDNILEIRLTHKMLLSLAVQAIHTQTYIHTYMCEFVLKDIWACLKVNLGGKKRDWVDSVGPKECQITKCLLKIKMKVLHVRNKNQAHKGRNERKKETD